MPRALEPNLTFDVVLESDQDKPTAEQPAFVYRTLNGREWRKMAALSDRMDAGGFSSSGEPLDVIFDVCSIGLVGWRNMNGPSGEIAFNPKDLDLLIDPIEAQELMREVMKGNQVSPSDKKKSESAA